MARIQQNLSTNRDCVSLTVADLVYLTRVITGDALPFNKLRHGQSFQFSNRGGVLATDVELGAVLFVFEGLADVQFRSTNMQMKTGMVDGNTHVLVFSFDGYQIPAGEVIAESSRSRLLSVEASGIIGERMTPRDLVVGPTENLTVYQNFPNPFNTLTRTRFDLLLPSAWKVEILTVNGTIIETFEGYAGNERVQVSWLCVGFPTGVYYYRVTAGGVSITKQMIKTT